MDLQTLRYFQQVADGATVTETATNAHLSQPALSRALARVEREVDAELFQQVGRTLTLTPAGHAFKEHVDALLDRYDRGLRVVAAMTDPDVGLVPLAFLHTLGTWLVPPLVSGFLERHPNTRFELRQHGEAGLVDELLDGTADLVITSDDPAHPQIEWRRLLEEPLRLVVPPGHRLAARRRVRLAEVAGERFVLLRPGFGLRATTERLCREAGFEPNVVFEGEDVATLRGLVTAGLGVSLLPPPQTAVGTSAGDAHPAPHIHVADVRGARDIGIAWRVGRTLPPASESFMRHVREASRRLPYGRSRR